MVGKKIKELRELLNMTQEELANKVGYTSKTTIAKIEAEKNDVRQNMIVKFADALHTTPSYLMGWDDNEVSPESYYSSEETTEIAQQIFDNKELRLLFDAAKDADSEDLKTVHQMLLALKNKGRREYDQ